MRGYWLCFGGLRWWERVGLVVAAVLIVLALGGTVRAEPSPGPYPPAGGAGAAWTCEPRPTPMPTTTASPVPLGSTPMPTTYPSPFGQVCAVSQWGVDPTHPPVAVQVTQLPGPVEVTSVTGDALKLLTVIAGLGLATGAAALVSGWHR